jgi:death on curing protein
VILATTLAVGIAQNHAFEQGNKRTAFAAAIHFLELNGYDVVAPDTEVLGEMFEGVIIHAIPETTFTEFLRQFLMPKADPPTS